MKVVWISIALFLLMIVGIILNAIYVHQSSEYLYACIESLENPAQREQALSALEDFWEKHQALFGLSVSFRELDHFGELLAELRWAHEQGLNADFKKCCTLLRDAVEEITRNERISVKNLF